MQISDPHRGLVGKINHMQRLIMRRGLKDMSTTNFGVVLIIIVPDISVEKLAIKRSENEFWLTGENEVLDIKVSREKEEIETMLNLIVPKLAQEDVEKLSESNRWVVLIICTR